MDITGKAIAVIGACVLLGALWRAAKGFDEPHLRTRRYNRRPVLIIVSAFGGVMVFAVGASLATLA